MISKRHAAALRSIQHKMQPLVDSLRPSPMYWVAGGGADQGLDFCRACAEAYAATVRVGASRPDDIIVDGGWDVRRDADGHAACATCGCTLGYNLTRFGFGAELEAFESCDFSQPLSSEAAYAVDAICDAAQYASNVHDVRLAIKIGRAAVAAMRQQ